MLENIPFSLLTIIQRANTTPPHPLWSIIHASSTTIHGWISHTMDQKDLPRPWADGCSKSHITGSGSSNGHGLYASTPNSSRIRTEVLRHYMYALETRTDHQNTHSQAAKARVWVIGCRFRTASREQKCPGGAYLRCSPRAKHHSKTWRRRPDEDLGTSCPSPQPSRRGSECRAQRGERGS